jgi:Transposase
VREVARLLEVSDQSIYTWRRQELIDRGELPGLSSTERKELRAATRRIKELRDRTRGAPPGGGAAEGVGAPKRRFEAISVMAGEGLPVEVACRVLMPTQRIGRSHWPTVGKAVDFAVQKGTRGRRGSARSVELIASGFLEEPLWNCGCVAVRPSLLLHARELVAQGWTQHADARAADDSVVHPWDATAVRWSLLGALVAGVEEAALGRGEAAALKELARTCVLLADAVDADSLELWNDAAERTHLDVLAALDGAAALPARAGDDPVGPRSI